jgi:F-type H+-transporting ATPase subunit gamma
MASTRLIKRRIKSAKNISQITKAMEMVAASKMKKAQNAAVSGKPYAEKIYQTVFELAKRLDISKHPLLKKNLASQKTLVITISTNKGLCGGLNTNLFRFINKIYPDKKNTDFIAVGKKSENFIIRSERNLIASFGQKGLFTELVAPITEMAVNEFLKGNYKDVYLVYNDFINAIRQEPSKKKILPLGIQADQHPEDDNNLFSEFIIEPNDAEVLNALLPHYLENQLRSAILEGEASEHSARMMAMKNATDSALELMGDLTLEYNKARQEKITSEIADLVTAGMAVR